jgi:release factor glutamine methyltransferase
MPSSLSHDLLPALIATLRAAGCVFAEDEAQLIVSAARTPADATAMAHQRASGLPLEHVVGWAEFCGLRIAMDPGVFVPRRRTEFLVRQAEMLARATATPAAAPPVVADLCCGSGALGAALAARLGRAEVHACDIDPAAVRCARRNLAPFSGHVYEGDLYGPLPATLRGRVGILVANAPYVPTKGIGLLPAEARVHEPVVALDGGGDGLEVLRRVSAAAPRWLAPGGHLLTETSERQAPAMAAAMAGDGLSARVAHCGELNATVVIGTRAANVS